MYLKNLRKQPLWKLPMCTCFPSHDSLGNVEACPRGVSLRPMPLTVQDVKSWLLFGLLKPNCPQAFLTIKMYYMFMNRRFLGLPDSICNSFSPGAAAMKLQKYLVASQLFVSWLIPYYRFLLLGVFFWVALFWVCFYLFVWSSFAMLKWSL